MANYQELDNEIIESMKRCKTCKNKFTPRFNSMEPVCQNIECAVKFAQTEAGGKHAAKAKRKEYREQKIKLKTRGDWYAEAQTEFNKWIRQRDKDAPCISCGRTDPPSTRAGQWHSGHFRSVGAYPELRFHEDNCSKECLSCNNFDSNHLEGYRKNLIKKIGLERVEWLEGPHELPHRSIDEIKEIKMKYRRLTRELIKENE